MSLWTKLGKFFAGSSSGESRKSDQLYVIDAERLVSSRGGDRPGPLERVEVLQRLSRFAGRENVKIQAVFAGKPLREVGHGGEFNGVFVFYSDQASSIPEELIKLTKSARRPQNVVVITADPATEDRARELGASVLRTSTLRRAMEPGDGGGDRGGGQDRSQRQQRFRRPRRPRSQDDRPSNHSSSSSSSSSEASGGGDVKDLIDLVE